VRGEEGGVLQLAQPLLSPKLSDTRKEGALEEIAGILILIWVSPGGEMNIETKNTRSNGQQKD